MGVGLTLQGKIQFRNGTAAEWTSANPVLLAGEMGVENNTGQFKVGDGATAWNSLGYGGLVGPAVSIDAVPTNGSTTNAVSSDGVFDALALKAPLASPAFTGNPTAPTPTFGDADTSVATTGFVAAAVTALINSSPAALDTLNELATALGNDANFSTTVTNALALKAPLASPALTGNPTAPTQTVQDSSTKLANTAFVNAEIAADAPNVTLGPVGAAPNANAMTLVGQLLNLQPASASFPGLMSAAMFALISAMSPGTKVFAAANQYQNLAIDGVTSDTTALNALMAAVPDNSTIVWPGGGSTMVLNGAAVIPGGKHLRFEGGGADNRTNWLQVNPTADHITAGDWFSSFSGIAFTTNYTSCTTHGQAISSGTVITVGAINTALVAASGTLNIGSSVGWQTLTYSARTGTTVTLSQAGTGTTVAASGVFGRVVFKTAGAAINAGNFVGIHMLDCSGTCLFNGYVCSGTTANQSVISSNTFLDTINFDVAIDGANWNGIISDNTADCNTANRTLSHLEITQCGSATGRGNQWIRGQYNMRLGSLTAAYPLGVFGVYFDHSFYDNAGIDAIKFQGISAIQRVKLTGGWVSSAAGSGIDFASTASTLPSGIEFHNVDVFANGAHGVTGAGVKDYKFIGGQAAGNVTSAFNISAAAGSVTYPTLLGVRIGPVAGFAANGTGIIVATGTYDGLVIGSCDDTGNTTALTLGTVTVATPSKFRISDNPGINPHGAVTTPAVPGTGVTVTNTTGFRVLVIQKFTAIPTGISINGVVCVVPAAASVYTSTLDPGGTITTTGGTYTWTWVGQ